MNFDYDCSFSDTDPYEPQPGGTASIFPFFLGKMVELPYTLPQDHTLINVLRINPLSIWSTKARWITSLGGMVLMLVHPDYSGDDRHLPNYEEVLRLLADTPDAWRALPIEAADWWRERARMHLILKDGRPYIEGEGSGRAVVRKLSEEPLAR
jgi:hypothetical protein